MATITSDPHLLSPEPAGGTTTAARGGLVAWWLDELAAAMPRQRRRHRPARRARAAGPAYLLRRNGDDAVEVFRRRGGGADRLGTLELPPPLPAPVGGPATAGAAPSLLAPASRDLVQQLARRRLPVILLLEEDEGLLCTDPLPAGAVADLDRIMPHRIDLLTPWPAGRVHAGYRVLGPPRDGRVDVLLGVAPRAAVDPTLARLAAYGVAVDAVDLIGEDGDPAGVDLLAAARERAGAAAGRRGRGRRWAGLAAFLTLLIVATGSALATIETLRLRAQLDQRQRYLTALEDRMADLPGLQARIEALRRNAGFVPERQAATPSPVVVLEVLSRLLPDSIWLDQVELDGDQLTLSGYAEDAAQVLPIVESSAHFARVEFRAPSTRVTVTGPGGGQREVERFSLGAVVTPLAEPET